MIRLKELRQEKGFTQRQMAEELGLTKSTYNYWENGKIEIDFKSLQKLADYFGVSVGYLIGAEPHKKSPPNAGKGKWIPVYGEIAAGIPIEAIEDIVDEEEISAEMAASGEHIALRIKGDSMGPRIHSGDVVIVRLQPCVENGEIAAVYVNGDSATLKRIRKEKSGLWLIADNPAYQPTFYSAEECKDLPITILGKLVELRAKF